MMETLLGVGVILGLPAIFYLVGIAAQIAMGDGDDLATGPEALYLGIVVVVALAILAGFGKVLGMMILGRW